MIYLLPWKGLEGTNKSRQTFKPGISLFIIDKTLQKMNHKMVPSNGATRQSGNTSFSLTYKGFSNRMAVSVSN